MTETRHSDASAARILKATIWALVAAGLILSLLVWPFGFGVGPGWRAGPEAKTEGSAAPNGDAGDSPAVAEDDLAALIAGNIRDADPGSQQAHSAPFKAETVHIALAALEEVEFKAHMSAGDTLLYNWRSPQPVYVDLHGEPYTYPDEPAVRYEEVDGASSGHGRITAQFTGMHGWFWLNTSEEAIVIELDVAGFYDRLEEVYRSSP